MLVGRQDVECIRGWNPTSTATPEITVAGVCPVPRNLAGAVTLGVGKCTCSADDQNLGVDVWIGERLNVLCAMVARGG